MHQRAVQLGSNAKKTDENELTSSIIAPRSKSDGDLAPDNIEISKGELNAAFKLATKGVKDFHFDSMALIVGSGG